MNSTQSQHNQEHSSALGAEEIPSSKRIQIEEDGDQQDALNSIRVMLEREQASYTMPSSTEEDESSPKPFSTFVKPNHRKRMVEWCFTMVETMELRRETIERAINCIDRFILLKGGRILLSDPILYQRAVITALYSMVKCHEEEAIPIEDMAFVCSGGDENNDVSDEDLDHTSEQLAAMEVVLLNELGWNVNPPTSYEYLAHFLTLLNLPFTNEFDPVYGIEEETPSSEEQEENSDTKWLLELAMFEIQQNLQDYDTAAKGAFHSAYNAIMNALPMLDGGAKMADRLEALLSTTVPDLERYRLSETSSSTSASTTSRLSSFEEEAEDIESLASSDDSSIDSSSSDDSSISSAEDLDSVADELPEETIVETTIEIRFPDVGSESHQEMFRSHHDASGDMFRSNHDAIGDITKLGLEDSESPSCVMDRGLSSLMLTSSLVAQTATLLEGDD